jgi:hypothetical protein
MVGTPTASASRYGSSFSTVGDSFGPTFYVDTVRGQGGNSGLFPTSAFPTVQAAFDALSALVVDGGSGVASNATIYVIGDIREQVTAPLGVYGVKIVGLVGGNPRNATENGVVKAGLGAVWRNPASASAGVPLITVREQGWEFHNLLFNPGAGITAVRLRTQEDADYPSAGHAVFRNVRFIGASALGTPVGTAIGDYGGAGFVSVDGCQFQNLEYGIHGQNFAIATPLMWRVGLDQPNIFQLCKNDILTNASGWTVGGNQHLTVYDGTAHPNTLNLASSATGTYPNRVTGAVFADAIADITVSKGYKTGNAADVWRYFASATAAYSVASPT